MNENVKKYQHIIQSYRGRKLRIMEVCGTHTHEIFKLGIRSLLPEQIELISGPGCPVCVTPASYIDEALFLLKKKNVTICTFGDLMRVPGNKGSLQQAKTEGFRVRVVYSPLDAVDYAEKNLQEQVVFLAVGFETTIPVHCLAMKRALTKNIGNFTMLTALKTMPAIYEEVKDYADAFLYPGHVHAISGEKDCQRLRDKCDISGVISGFEGEEILYALSRIVELSAEDKAFFENAYEQVARKEGNMKACALIEELTEICDSEWRGFGVISNSGREIRKKYQILDARERFKVPRQTNATKSACRCAEVLKGTIKPQECQLFGNICTPEYPSGACMVSHEGACAAYYKYGI